MYQLEFSKFRKTISLIKGKMASAVMITSCVIFIIAFLSCCLSVHAQPDLDQNCPHVVKIDISEYFLFTLIGKINANFSDVNLLSVFRQIVNRHHLVFEDFNFKLSLPLLGSKLRRMWTTWIKKSGGHWHSKLRSQWEKSKYTCKVYHKTGSPTKRKLEDEVVHAQVARRKLEDDLKDTSTELGKCRAEKEELERKVDRLANPTKQRLGVRGRRKGKSNYSKCQKWRHKQQKIEAIKETLMDISSPGLRPCTFEFKDDEGEKVTVMFNGGNGEIESIQTNIRTRFG